MRIALLALLVATSAFADDWKFLTGSTLVKAERKVKLWMTVFKESEAALKVIDQGDTPSKRTHENLKAAMKSVGAITGTNGGFFQKDFRPMGLTICDGVRIGKFSSAKLLSGVLFSQDGKIQIQRRDAFRDNKGITQLLQAGPFLVENAQPIKGLHPGEARARTFIATDGKGTWALAVVRSTSLPELSEILSQPGLFPQIKIATALNLDGGSSSGFWSASTYTTKWTRVRNFIAITP
jgi:uncharacterized protein YigE (DUF2233 family)